MNRRPPPTYPTFAADLLEARRRLTVAIQVGLAIRAHRHELGVSQRAYARRRGWSSGHGSRLECDAGRLRLDDVVTALEGTGFVLALCHAPLDPPVGPVAALRPGSPPAPDVPRAATSPLTATSPPTEASPPPETSPPASRPTPSAAHVPTALPHTTSDPTAYRPPVPVRPDHWPRCELVARVRDGSRRFPAHHDTVQVSYPPRWWWLTESTTLDTEPPHWTARDPADPWGEPVPRAG